MVIEHKRWADSERKYPGEDQAGFLVEWLNSPGDRDSSNFEVNQDAKARIAEILDGLATIGAAADEELDKTRSIASQINQILIECAIVPQVEINVWHPLPLPSKIQVGCSFDFHPALGTRHHAELQDRPLGRPFTAPLGHHAFMMLFDIWRSGYIGNLIRCKGCGRFLYKHRRKQESCSDRCREDAHKRSEQYKEKRNARLKKNYSDARQREFRNLERVKKGKRLPPAGSGK